MGDRHVLIVTGWREAEDCDVWGGLSAHVEEHGQPAWVVLGGARGADTWAEFWCRDNGVPHVIVPPLWDREGKAAGPVRNARMITVAKSLNAHLVPLRGLGFLAPESKGTRDMLRRMESAGVEVEVIRVGP